MIRNGVEEDTYDRTFEKSLEGDITKLSAEPDQAIKWRILWSSSMLHSRQLITSDASTTSPNAYLYNL